MAESEVDASLGQLTLVTAPPPTMTTIDIATTDGDVLLTLGETRLRVSSVILSSASPVFKTMLGPKYLEGQGDRSAQNPKEIPLLDDDPVVMTRLCRLLHHQREALDLSPPDLARDEKSLILDAQGLFNLAVLADKYGCADGIQMSVGYLLHDLGSGLDPREIPMAVLLHLVTAAYIFEDDRHFALFTRRLVMDHVNVYSTTAADDPSLAMLPTLILCKCHFFVTSTIVLTEVTVLVEEQRKAAWLLLHNELPKLATSRCQYDNYSSCSVKRTDYNFCAALVAEFPHHVAENPVSWPSSDRSLRYILKETYNCSSAISCNITRVCGHSARLGELEWTVTCGDLRALCNRVNKVALGLCLARIPGQGTVPDKCSHQLLERWAEQDTFV